MQKWQRYHFSFQAAHRLWVGGLMLQPESTCWRICQPHCLRPAHMSPQLIVTASLSLSISHYWMSFLRNWEGVRALLLLQESLELLSDPSEAGARTGTQCSHSMPSPFQFREGKFQFMLYLRQAATSYQLMFLCGYVLGREEIPDQDSPVCLSSGLLNSSGSWRFTWVTK